MIETAKRAVKYGPDLSDANSLLAELIAKNHARKVAERILKIDGSINFKKLRRAMKTFIIMDRSFIGKLADTFEEAGIPS